MAVDSINNFNNINSAYATQKYSCAQNVTAPIGLNNQSSGGSSVIMSGNGANVCVSPAGDVLEKRASSDQSVNVQVKNTDNGEKIVSTTDTNKGILLDRKTYFPNGNLKYAEKFNPETGNRYQAVLCGENGNKISEFFSDPKTGNPSKIVNYQSDGVTKQAVQMYDPSPGKYSRTILFQEDGRTPAVAMKIDQTTKKPVHIIYYDNNGKIDSVSKYDSETGKEEKRIQNFNDYEKVIYNKN